MILSIDANGWVTIIVALGGFATIMGGVIVSIIVAMKANRKIDHAERRREEIAASPPGNPSPPPTLSAPKE